MDKYLLTWTDGNGFHALEFTNIFEARKYVIDLDYDCKDIKTWQIIDEYMNEEDILP